MAAQEAIAVRQVTDTVPGMVAARMQMESSHGRCARYDRDARNADASGDG